MKRQLIYTATDSNGIGRDDLSRIQDDCEALRGMIEPTPTVTIVPTGRSLYRGKIKKLEFNGRR